MEDYGIYFAKYFTVVAVGRSVGIPIAGKIWKRIGVSCVGLMMVGKTNYGVSLMLSVCVG